MNQHAVVGKFSHVKPGDTEFREGGMYEDKLTLVQAGDVVHQRPGITHYLYDYSKDMEYLEIVSPADFKTVDVAPFVDKVPPPTLWK